MDAYEISRFLKGEIEHRKDQIIEGLPNADLVAQYNYKIGFLHALMQVQDWVKEWEAKRIRIDLEE
jgi:hypothetical protein